MSVRTRRARKHSRTHIIGFGTALIGDPSGREIGRAHV